ncbi:MAG: response regulator [Deltaproteobacteria bacterium]|nr:MAG: response regulator [Deltaproteobacteria bacterium]
MPPAPTFSSVLVIDDEPVVLDVFQRVLGEKGLSTRLARNAEEALAFIEREEFGCVLADKNLPGLDGIEIVRRVRQSQPHCACIVMTAYATTESAVEALRLGAVDYIAKPFDDLDRIAARIDDALRQMKAQYERRSAAPQLRLVGSEAANERAARSFSPARRCSTTSAAFAARAAPAAASCGASRKSWRSIWHWRVTRRAAEVGLFPEFPRPDVPAPFLLRL